ncbi:mannose-specific phosphotransferase system (PTS), IID component [Streptococcus porcinus]|uniref:Mannose-specific phosphotransferase system (PTS), IID component n=2 Tax=Streptococcus porcinus TaxID=1340 RepID=A0A4V0HDY2_STRPO|nr:mannose-specific phosphotransferase system (PTS), IID component [Streptococcus porcinus]VTT46077.1 mannose-specific phosphotransferase system (PTS), IID component [Streptococcus porcinus]VTT47336.1 mannose-specific phosphotransferase system (PTS), IID component [Streptococcus porcinus]
MDQVTVDQMIQSAISLKTTRKGPTMTEQIKLSKSDRQKVWWRSQFLQGSWNYERMQNLGWAYALIPAIKKLYTTKEDQSAALARHLEFFNTHPYVAAPIMGVTLALEEERANGTDIDDAAIQGVKIGMMGPLAGIGDPVFWFTVRPILGALGASLASSGNIVGPLLFFFGWNIIRMAFLWYTQEFGYKAGSEITKDMSGGILQDITKGASILGMFILAVLVERWVSIKFTVGLPSKLLSKGAYVEFPKGNINGAELKGILGQALNGMSLDKYQEQSLQGQLDSLIPGLMGLALTFLCMWLLKKKVSPITIIIALFAVGILARVLHIM